MRKTRSAADLWGFFAFSHGWTWLFWGLVILWGVNVWESPWAIVLFAIGGLGVPIGGVVMTGRVAGHEGLRDLGRRAVDPGRISGWWWAAILLLQPAVKLAAGGLAVLFGVTDAPFNLQEAAVLAVQPADLLLYLAFVLWRWGAETLRGRPTPDEIVSPV